MGLMAKQRWKEEFEFEIGSIENHPIWKRDEKIEKINRTSGTCEITSKCLTQRENGGTKNFFEGGKYQKQY